ncbi:MAG: coiled-coil domain-containing protein [Methylomonas sp.]
MNAINFDTHEFFNELRSSGFSEQQAETITRLQKAAIASTLEQAKHEYDLDNISTKPDLNELELRLTIKMGTMLSVAVAAIAALVKLL